MTTYTEKMDDSKKIEKYQKKLADIKSKRQRKDFWQPRSGQKGNHIRILPNWNGDPEGDFYRETAYHRKLGTEAEKSAVCLLREGQDVCPVCSLVKELYKTKKKEDADLAKRVRAQTRVLYNIVDLDEPDKGVQIMGSGVDVLEQLIAYCGNPKYGDVSDPERGRNIDLFLTEGKDTKSGYNEYNVQPDPDRTPIQDPEWLGQMTDLDTLVKPMSYEELDALLTGAPIPEKKAETVCGVCSDDSPQIPDQGKPCFERAKFSSDDVECQECELKVPCSDRKKAKSAIGKSTTEDKKTEVKKEEPKIEKAQEPKIEKAQEPKIEKAQEPKIEKAQEPKTDQAEASTKVQKMLAKLREEKEEQRKAKK